MTKLSKVLGLAAALAAAAPAAAQQPAGMEDNALRRIRISGGLALLGAVPVGEFADNVDGGGGLGGHVALPLGSGPFSLRASGGFVIYGSETQEVCFSSTVGCRVELDLTTRNSIALLHVGPFLAATSGPVRPYAGAGIGLAYFWTQSSVDGTNDTQSDFASTTNFDDLTWSWNAGGGLQIPLPVRSANVAIDLGAWYTRNGKVEYLREGDITDNPVGSISLNPVRSDADFVLITLGASISTR